MLAAAQATPKPSRFTGSLPRAPLIGAVMSTRDRRRGRTGALAVAVNNIMQPSHRRRFFELPALCIATVMRATTLSTKAAYQTKIDGVPFSKPFFMELLVGLAMTTPLLAVPCRPKLPRRGRSWFRHLLPLMPLAVSDLLVGLCGAILFCAGFNHQHHQLLHSML